MPVSSNEQRYYDALKRITQYQSPERMRRSSEKDWGLGFQETLEYAYENIQDEARNTIRGRRRPKDKTPPERTSSATSEGAGTATDGEGR